MAFIIEWMLFSDTHITVLVFYRIVPLQAVKQSVCSVVRGASDWSGATNSASDWLSTRGVRGAIVSWIAPPAHLSHQPHCLWWDYQGCILSTEDRDQVYFHFSVPPVFSGHVPWHFMTSLALASLFLLHFTSSSFLGTHSSQLRAQTNFTFSSQMQQPLLVLPLSEIC